MTVELPVLPAHWGKSRVDRVASVNARIGWKALTAAEYQPRGFTFLSTPNIKGREIDFDNVNYITEARYQESPELKLREGDVLLAKDGNTLGIVNLVKHLPRPATVNGSIAVIRPTGIDGAFLRYVLASRVTQAAINMLKGGMGVPHLFQWDINRLPVPVPTTGEQRRIADFLDVETARIDQLTQLRSRTLDLLREQVVAQVDSAVRGGSTRQTRPAEYPPLGQIPVNWLEGRLRSVDCDVQTGPFGSQLHAEDYIAGGWPVINPANIAPSGLAADERVTISSEIRERLARHILQAGDVIFGRRGELGRAGVVSTEQAGWVCGTGSLRVRFHNDAFHSGYLRRYLTIPAVRHYFQLHAIGSTMANLNSSILLNMPLLLPGIGEQVSIAAACDEIEEQAARRTTLVKRQLALLAERRQALITAAVTGQFDVSTASGRNLTDGVSA